MGMEGKVCLVTGANDGIGLATAVGLAEQGALVVMAVRSQERGEPALEEVKRRSGNQAVYLLAGDLAEMSAVQQLTQEFSTQFDRLDVLVNNAAVIPQSRQITSDGFEMQWAVNHLAPFLLTNLLLDTLKASTPSRVVTVSSVVHSSGSIDFEEMRGKNTGSYSPSGVYSDTKMANVLFTVELARRLQGNGVTTNCLHPGVINTKLFRSYMGRGGGGDEWDGFSELERGAATTIYLASSPEVEMITGKYFSHRAETSAASHTQDEAMARRLWQVSEELLAPWLN